MGAFVVVELDVVAYPLTQLHDRVGRIDIDVFLLDSAPEPFYPDVVLAAAPAIHADEDAVLFQEVFPCLCCILRALVAVDDLRRTELADTFFEHLVHVVSR